MQLIARYELKYAIPLHLMEPIRAFIRPYCVLDEHGRPEKQGYYTIDSLYCDSQKYRTYWDTEERAPVRAKLRIRTYPDAPGSVVKYEIKRRVHDMIVKTSAVVAQRDWDEWLRNPASARALPPAERAVLEEFSSRLTLLRGGPKMLVRYERQAFRSVVEDYARVTFDRRMRHQQMLRYSLDPRPNHWIAMDDGGSLGASGQVLLELKFRNRAPIWMAELARRFGLVRQGYSKYCAAVRRSVMERTPFRDFSPARRFAREAEWTS